MKKTWQIPLTITFILLGILLSTQLQTQNRLAAFTTEYQRFNHHGQKS